MEKNLSSLFSCLFLSLVWKLLMVPRSLLRDSCAFESKSVSPSSSSESLPSSEPFLDIKTSAEKSVATSAEPQRSFTLDPEAPSLLRPEWGEPLRFGSTANMPLP